jgi:Xaa-Pro dipeptidase
MLPYQQASRLTDMTLRPSRTVHSNGGGMARERAFSVREYKQRLASAQAEMRARGLDVLMVYWPENIYYLTGYHTIGYFSYQVLFVSAIEDPIMLVRRLDRQNVRDLTWLGACEVYQDTEDPIEVTFRALTEHGWAQRSIGVELDAWFLTTRHFLDLRRRLGDVELSDGSQLVNRIRLIKSEAEVRYIRAAARAAESSAVAAIRLIRPGIRECDVAARMHQALFRAGSAYLGHPPLLGSGPRASRASVTWSERVIRANEPVHIEPGGCVRRYHAMFIRTVHVGTPRDRKFLKLVDLSLEGLNEGLATVRAGVSATVVDEALKRPVRRAGFGDLAFSRGGYSIGIGFPPDWGESRTQSIKQGDRTILQANMTLHLLSNLWYEGKALVGFSETVRVTPSGCEVLTRFPRKLIVRSAGNRVGRRP